MENSTLKFNGLSDEQIILAASQLVAATCASLPRLDDEREVLVRVQRLFDRHCQDLLARRTKGAVLVSAEMNLK